jgi:hypothetical protein
VINWRPGLSFDVDPDTPGMDYTFQWADWLEGEDIEEFEVIATDGVDIVSAVLDEIDGKDITVVIKRGEEENKRDRVTCRVKRATSPETGTDRSIQIRWVDQ